MATKKKLQMDGVDIVPQTTLDNIVLDVTATGYTTSIASGGKIKSEYMQSATGTTVAGVVYNNDPAHLTISGGGLSVHILSRSIGSVDDSAGSASLVSAGAIQDYVSGYINDPDLVVAGASHADAATSATSAGHATSAGTAGALAVGVVVSSASAATTAGTATNATSAASAGYATSAGSVPVSSLPLANGTTTSGVVFNNDPMHLTITNGGIALKILSSSIESVDDSAGSASLVSAAAIRQYVSDFVHDPDVTVAWAESAVSATNATNATSAASAGYAVSAGTLTPFQAVTTVPAASASVTLGPGKFYKVDATTTSKTLNVSSFNIDSFGHDSYLELFVANTGYVHTGSNVTLVDPLEPDAVNNCVVRFHDAHAIVTVTDHVAAYMVNNVGSGSATAGTLSYGLKQTGSNYRFIGFRSEFNDSVIPTGGVAPTVIKHLVGNGMGVGPTISGTLAAAAGVTIRDLKVSDLTMTSGSLSLGEVAVVSGSTVGVTAAAAVLHIQHVTGDGRIYVNSSVDLDGAQIDCYVQAVSGIPTISTALQFGGSGILDLNGTKLTMTTANANVYISGMTFTNGGLSTSAGGFALIQSGATATFSNCLITGNTSTNQGGGVYLLRTSVTFDGCSFMDNDASNGQGAYINASATLNLINCNFTHARGTRAQNIVFAHTTASATIAGVCKFTALVSRANASTSGTLIISSGAVVDLSGNSASVPVIPGGKIIVDGGCTVVNSAGVDIHVNGGTYTQIANTGVAS